MKEFKPPKPKNRRVQIKKSCKQCGETSRTEVCNKCQLENQLKINDK